VGRLDGKVAVITGANGGLGLPSAKRLSREGAQVFMGDDSVQRTHSESRELTIGKTLRRQSS
jgi:NAD(P)-dependent dehydrogenase (short-subunit alcohol dehydrogenase family)